MFSSEWYYNLTRPILSPPDWIFAPMWTFLYILIIIALILYSITPAKNKKYGYIFFIIQILLNFSWSPIFFLMQNITLALIVIILLDIFVILTIRKFYSVSKISGIILVPYLIWILFATYLNIGYLILN